MERTKKFWERKRVVRGEILFVILGRKKKVSQTFCITPLCAILISKK